MLMCRSGTAGNTTPRLLVPQKYADERHLHAEEREERVMRERERERKEERGERKMFFLNKIVWYRSVGSTGVERLVEDRISLLT